MPARAARAAQAGVTITDVRHLDVQTTDYGTRPQGIRADGQVAYCAQGYLSAPRPGDVYTSPRTVEGTALDYVVYHGYDGKAVTELYGARGDHAEMATAAAVWIVRGDAEGNQQWRRRWEGLREQDIKDAAKRLADEAKAWEAAGGRGPERGSAVIYDFADRQGQQDIVMKRPRVKITLVKTSSNPVISDGSACYSLEGAVFGIYTDARAAQEVGRMTTDAAGRASSEALQPGTYYVKEITPPRGYALSDKIHKVAASKDVELEVSNMPQNDPVGVVVKKLDAETGKASPLGAGTLAGAEFTLRFYAGDYKTEAELPDSPTRSWVLKTDEKGVSNLAFAKIDPDTYLASGDELYIAPNGDPTLPLGTLTIQETKAPKGYTLTDPGLHIVPITSDGWAESVETYVAPEVREQAVRGDVAFNKIADRTQGRLGGVPFLITSKTTGESHVVVTDENGYISTEASFAAHSERTNASDTAWNGKEVDESKLVTGAGVWFSGAKDETTAANDGLGALPYDTYEVRELRSSANRDFELVSFDIKVTRDAYTVSAGTVTNTELPRPAIRTTATSKEDGAKAIRAGGEVALVDTVSYTNLEPGKTYTLKGTLMDKETKEPLKDADGKEITATREFTPSEASGTVALEFTFDNTGREGRETVVFEKVFLGDVAMAAHADIDDKDQTVTSSSIKTTATSEDGRKYVLPEKKAKIVDAVAYENLIPGKTYTLRGALMDKETKEPLKDADGKEITAAREFVPEEASGTVELEFEVNTEKLVGKKIVAFERVERDGRLVAAHADIEDGGQTVEVVPKAPPALPQTGIRRFAPVLAGVAVAAGAGAVLIMRARPRRHWTDQFGARVK
ncbi:MAG: hypothetical protein E7001_00540 [Coriobacteriaceae bacterium]|nr:hypothetical protein [Coriobacteriaceae bacterium]